MSKASIINFFKMNIVIMLVGLLQYSSLYDDVNSIYKLSHNIMVHFMKNYLILFLIDFSLRNKKYIHDKVQPVSNLCLDSIYYIMMASIIEGITFYMASSLISFKKTHYLYDLLTLFPISFIMEIIFDFCHYWAHRISHTKHFYGYHKIHHLHKYPTSVTTFYQHPIDLIIANVIPTIITFYLIRVSMFQASLISIYKTFIEISGHTGKLLYPISSFPQFMWLPKLLGMELYGEDHDVHHTHYKYNFAKRFSLWDKVFGTYLSYREVSKTSKNPCQS